MKIAIFGPQGSGKGTYAKKMGPLLGGIPQINTGDIFREAIASGSALGKKVEPFVRSGALVPDDLVIEALEERLARPDAAKGWILDGFPRNRAQAVALDRIAQLDVVINLHVPERILLARLGARRICAKCGEIYNLWTGVLPKKKGVCDKCGSRELIQREDDKPEAIRKRLALYHSQTEPLLEHYRAQGKLIDVQWEESDIPPGAVDVPPDVMLNKIMAALRTFKKVGGQAKRK